MKKLLVNWVLSAVCLYILSLLFSGIAIDNFGTALFAAFVMGLINAVIKPILTVLTFPITLITLGFFSLVINALMLSLTSAFVSGFNINGFWTAFFAAIVLSILNLVFIKNNKDSKE